MQTLISLIESAFENRAVITPQTVPNDLQNAITDAINLLDAGKARIAEKINGQWQINQWLKKAVLLYFRIHENNVIDGGFTQYYNKVALKFDSSENIVSSGARIVPPAVARKGAYIAPNSILMRS